MKPFYLLFVSFAVLSACGKPVCTISGTLSDPVDSVRLVDRTGTLVDACAVTDGSFTLKCDLDPESGVAILRGDDYDPISLIPDTKEIKVSMADGKPVVSGSPLSEGLQEFQQWAMRTFMDYSGRAMELMDAGNQAGADSLSAESRRVMTERCREIYRDHMSDPLGVQAMCLMMENLDKEEFLDLYERGGKVVREDAMIGGYYEHLKSLPRNEVVTLSENGEVVKSNGSFEDYVGAGHYTLVDFWASWCGPCKEETPNMVAVYEKYRDKGLVVIGVPVNDKLDASVGAMKALGIHYPQVLDPSLALAEKFGVTGIPHIILFDPAGKVVAEGLRGAMIEETVRGVLSE